MISNWDETKAKSNYHFDSNRVDTRESVMRYLGHITPTWTDSVAEIVATAKPATWATRGYKGEGVAPPREDQIKEDYDLERAGYGKDYQITHLNWAIPQELKKISDEFGLEDCMERIHVQKPGEVWNLHLDKLSKWCPEDPSRVMRIFVALTDWEPGQFWEYGNYHYNQWRAGDVTTFDWANIPHSTANAGMYARVTLQLTGVATGKTYDYLAQLPK